MKALFEFLFKFKPIVFQKGEWVLAGLSTPWLLAAMAGLTLIFVVLQWRFLSQRASLVAGRRALLLGLRGAVLLLLLFVLLRPSLLVSSVMPRQTVLGVLYDDSLSMDIRDDGQGAPSRIEQLQAVVRPGSRLVNGLQAKFRTQFYRFADQAERVDPFVGVRVPQDASERGRATTLENGLRQVYSELKDQALAAVVLVTDGADNSSRELNRVVQDFKSRKIPIHTVGVGREKLAHDVEITHVSAPRRLIPKSYATALVNVRGHGFGGRKVRLEVRDGQTLVNSKEFQLEEAGSQLVELNLFPLTSGTKVYTFSLQELAEDLLPQNNTRQAVVEVRDARPRVLYVEGEPRWEYKFIRQALRDDLHLQLETLLRTAVNKFYRQGIADESTLAAGFPTKKEDLFQYSGLIVGTVESAFFTFEQLEMIRDFVSRRGGGFLMLGGHNSFGEGKYQNTAVEDLLPTQLGSYAERDYREEAVQTELTVYGRRHPIIQLALSDQENEKRWRSLPALADHQTLGRLKPGAIPLASGPGGRPILLASQRYGRGFGLAFATGTSWRWQMLADAREDSHEIFWRQLLRWVVHSAREPLVVETDRENYIEGERGVLRAEVTDLVYEPLNDAQPQFRVRTPDGQSLAGTMSWSVREEGVYTAEIPLARQGVYEAVVEAKVGMETRRANSHFLVSGNQVEFYNAGQNVELLRSLSEQTGGRYYPLAAVNDLPDEIIYQTAAASRRETRELWDMPFLFLSITALLCTEWALRKKWGLA